MGNANSAPPPKIHKGQKEGNVDTGKGKQPGKNGSSKATSQSSQSQNGKKPNEHVTVIARAAGKLWSQMTPEQRKKYVDLANEEKKRRQERKRKRKRSSTHSR